MTKKEIMYLKTIGFTIKETEDQTLLYMSNKYIAGISELVENVYGYSSNINTEIDESHIDGLKALVKEYANTPISER